MESLQVYNPFLHRVKEVLINDSGPFSQDAQVSFYVESSQSDYDPISRIVQMLAQSKEGNFTEPDKPQCLISVGPSTFVHDCYDEITEIQTINIHFGTNASDVDDLLFAPGNPVWGILAIKKFIINKLHDVNREGTWHNWKLVDCIFQTTEECRAAVGTFTLTANYNHKKLLAQPVV